MTEPSPGVVRSCATCWPRPCDVDRSRCRRRPASTPLVDHVHGDPDDPCLEVCYAAGVGRADPDPNPDDLDRPRYRALARPFYDHPGSGDPDDPTGGHDAGCAAGHELTVYRVDAAWRELGGDRAHAPLGVAQVTGARLNVAAARAAIVDHLRLLADPLPTRVGPADVELYLEVT